MLNNFFIKTVIIFSLLVLGCKSKMLPKTEKNKRPNIIVIIVDDLGYGDIGYTGHPFIETPNINKLAEEGAFLSNFYSAASVCSPSRASMLTGLTNYKLGIYSFIHRGSAVHLKKEFSTYSQMLRNRGYQTAMIGKWHLANHDFKEKNPNSSIPSMEEYGYDYWFSSDDNAKILNKPNWWDNGKRVGEIKGHAANVVGNKAVNWLKNHRKNEQPFLLNMNFYEPHWYVDAPDSLFNKYKKQYKEGHKRAHYSGCINNVDNEIGSVINTLKELNIDKNTIIIFTSDHGPNDYAQDSKRDRNDGRSTPFRGNKYGLWDGSIHVPAMVYYPGVVEGNQIIDTPLSGVDFLSTICGLAEIKLPESIEQDGIDFSPLLFGKTVERRKTPLQWHSYNSKLKNKTSPNAVLRRGDYIVVGSYKKYDQLKGRYLKKHASYLKTSKLYHFALYNIKNDVKQEYDISKKFPEVFETLKKELIHSHETLQKDAYIWSVE